MALTEIFKTSFETIKAHKKPMIIFSLIASLLLFVNYYIPVYFEYFSLLFPFLWYLLLIPYIAKIFEYRIQLPQYLKASFIMGIIGSITEFLHTSVISYCKSLADVHLPLLCLIIIVSLPIVLILSGVIVLADNFFVFSLLSENSLKKSVKLFISKVSGNIIIKTLNVFLISFASELIFIILSIRPVATFYTTKEKTVLLLNSPVGTFLFFCEVIVLYHYWKGELNA